MISPALWLNSWLNIGLVIGSCLIIVFVVFLCICCVPRRNGEFFSQSGIGGHLFKKHSRSLVSEKTYKPNGNFDSKVEESIECKEIKRSFSSNKAFSDLDCYDNYKSDVGVSLSNESLSSFYSAYPLTISKSTSRESFDSILSV